MKNFLNIVSVITSMSHLGLYGNETSLLQLQMQWKVMNDFAQDIN